MRLKRFVGFGLGVVALVGLSAAPAGAHAGHAFVPSQSSSADSSTDSALFEAKLSSLNGSDSTGGAVVHVEGNKATVKLRTVSASKDMPHAQHIHIGGTNKCPDGTADTNGDGFTSVAEGAPFYGGIAVSLTTSGDVSANSGLAVDRFPKADGGFVTEYERTFDLPAGVNAAELANGVIVQHGISELFDDNYRYDGSKPSELDPSLPFEATVPSACGKLMKAGTPLLGLKADNKLVSFSASNPEFLVDEVAIKGLNPGERVLGIDVRPATGEVYALGSSSQLYVVDPVSGEATAKGNKLNPALVGDAVGFDFNPTVDRIRITTNASQDLRVHPDTGAVTVDGNLKYANGDVRSGSGARVVASAYTNNVSGATSTSLYNLDADSNSLVQQTPPNDGTLKTIGATGVDLTDVSAFDVSGDGKALAALSSGGPSSLYTIDLATGKATKVGSIGSDIQIIGLAASK